MTSVNSIMYNPRVQPLGANPVAAQSMLQVVGARTHNLKNISLEIAHNRLTVITGVSGSGKSSLAFDTIYAEGQRQYIESLSTYARQFLHQLQRPDVDSIQGLQPTLCIDQRVGAANPRSTVATITEIYDYLRLLMARVGTAHCYDCGHAIQPQSPDQILRTLAGLPEGTKLVLLAPVVRGRRGAHRDVLEAIQKAGLVRVRVDGQLFEIDAVPELAVRKNHTIEAVVDKIVIRPDNAQRLADSITVALRLADGLVSASYLTSDGKKGDQGNQWTEKLFSTRYACPQCGSSYDEIEPRTFSFNSPYGACPTCHGLGKLEGNAAARDGLKPSDDSWIELADDSPSRSSLQSSRASERCPSCQGYRLKPESLSVRLADRHIGQICDLGLAESLRWFESLPWTPDQALIANPILSEMMHRLQFLNQVGLSYLTLSRSGDSLSGGELQRVRLAASLGSGLVGVCYILDEPSIGLHQRDNDRLIESLRNLQKQGNTVLVVEHDEAMMRAADCLIDIGPGAGICGGQVVALGTPGQVQSHGDSITASYLRGERTVAPDRPERHFQSTEVIRLTGARLHNLQNVDLELPLGLLTAITGVSGSGKSSLIGRTLVPAIAKQLGQQPDATPGPFATLVGCEKVDKLIELTQQPIGRTPRSTPATYCGVFELIRTLFAGTREAKSRGFTASRFSFNAGTGRCSDCQGQGQVKIEMNFLPDLYVTCSTCNGQRYNRPTLQVRYRERSIADVLNMAVDQAIEFFENFEKIRRLLETLQQVGLGYLTLGQSSNTLSGGEAQRIKLATELARPETGKTIYFLDEPTTGLHFEDIRHLINVMNRLVDRGNTVIVIEHQLDLIRACDWVVDLGPDGGDRGGQIIAFGPPQLVAKNPASITGRFL